MEKVMMIVQIAVGALVAIFGVLGLTDVIQITEQVYATILIGVGAFEAVVNIWKKPKEIK